MEDNGSSSISNSAAFVQLRTEAAKVIENGGESKLSVERFREQTKVAKLSTPSKTSATLKTMQEGVDSSRDKSATLTQDMRERVDAILSYLNNEMIQRNRKITFNVDEGTGLTVVTVTNSSTGRVVQQLPPEEVLKLSANLESLKGLIFDDSQ